VDEDERRVFRNARDTALRCHGILQSTVVQIANSQRSGQGMAVEMLTREYSDTLQTLRSCFLQLTALQQKYAADQDLSNAVANAEAYFADLSEETPR